MYRRCPVRRSLLLSVFFVLALAFILNTGVAASEKQGEELFETHCALCHGGGGNVINPQKTLHADSLKKHGITTVDDIVKIMRNPKPGMIKFDEKKISNHDAEEIAEYILKTFK